MKDFFYTKKFKILLAVAVVLAGMMAWAGANNRLHSAPEEILGALLTPFQKVASLMGGGVDGLMDKYVRLDSIIEENERLTEENTMLREQLVDYDKMKIQLKAFQGMANIMEENPQYTYAEAFVIGRDPLTQFGSFIIDKGTAQGLHTNDVVVSDQGYLVGRVQEAGINSSRVMTILQPGSYTACAISRTRDSGNLSGSAEYAPEGLCVLENLSRDTQAIVGDEVITTGLGGEFPPDIRVGSIRELMPEDSGKSVIALVEPGADINNIKYVYIITNS